jgi:hypothetical protein
MRCIPARWQCYFWGMQVLFDALKGSGIVAKGTFSVCCMMRESPDVVRRFCQYYRQIGAEDVLMFWDGNPRGEERHALENAARAGGSSLVFCDDDFWRGLGVDGPNLHLEALQSRIYHFGYEQCKSDWMFFCDADEFLVSPVSVSDVLKAIPEDVQSLRVQNFEAVWGLMTIARRLSVAVISECRFLAVHCFPRL